MAGPVSLNRASLVRSLGDLGVSCGDSLLVHSAFRALGPVEGGPDALIDAILDVLGPTGNLMAPTFNYSSPIPTPYFDPCETPGRTGIVTEVLRKRPGAMRSLHPTHSVAVIGPDAADLTAGHLDTRAMGPNSPIDKLASRGGKILLIGCGMTSNTTIHVAEEHAGVPKASRYDTLPYIMVRKLDGSIIEHQLDASPSCSAAFEAAALPIRRRGAIRDGRIGGALVQMMSGQVVIDAVTELLSTDLAALLCSNPGCLGCSRTRARYFGLATSG